MFGSVADELTRLVNVRGGYVNAHSHLDIAYVLDLPGTRRALAERVGTVMERAGELPLQLKIDELDALLRRSDEYAATLRDRIGRAVGELRRQGGRAARTCFTIGTELAVEPLEEAAGIRDALDTEFPLQIVALPLRGLSDPAEYGYFAEVCKSPLVDVVGALPQNEPGTGPGDPVRVRAYFERLLELAAGLDKPVEAHVDEYLSVHERETEALAEATLDARRGGYRRGVAAVHAVTLAALSPPERRRVAARLAEARVGVVICPRAGLSMAPPAGPAAPTYLHNAIAPLGDLLAEGVTVGLGTDNIRDVFMPLAGGSMLAEIELLAEATRTYDLSMLADVATTGGAAILELDPA